MFFLHLYIYKGAALILMDELQITFKERLLNESIEETAKEVDLQSIELALDAIHNLKSFISTNLQNLTSSQYFWF